MAEYGAIDVLPALQPLREVTIELSDWQTFPQLYVNGELVGGCDIVEEMLDSGELADCSRSTAGGRGPRVRADPSRRRRRARRCSSAEVGPSDAHSTRSGPAAPRPSSA